MHIVMACPGMMNLKALLPARDGEESEKAAHGSIIHAALAGDPVDMTTFQAQTAQKCARIARELCDTFLGEEFTLVAEKRYWLKHEGQKIFSARLDLIGWNKAGTYLLLDYKTLPGSVPEAAENWQILSTAVAFLDETGCDVRKLYGAIVQPAVTSKPRVVEYSRDQLLGARDIIVQRLMLAQIPDVPRMPGNHCQYCECRTWCPEAHSLALSVPEQAGTAIEKLTPDRIVHLLGQLDAVESVCGALRKRARDMLEQDSECLPGWRLVERRGRLALVGLAALQGVLDGIREYVPREEFSSYVGASTSKLKDAFVKRYSLAKGCTLNDAIAEFSARVEPFCRRSASYKTMVRSSEEGSAGTDE